jgi:hypothetical protein
VLLAVLSKDDRRLRLVVSVNELTNNVSRVCEIETCHCHDPNLSICIAVALDFVVLALLFGLIPPEKPNSSCWGFLLKSAENSDILMPTKKLLYSYNSYVLYTVLA